MYKKDLSIIVPVYNEVENLRPLFDEITNALADEQMVYEVLFIDDGSSDGSFELLQALHEEDPRALTIRFRRNHGQTAGFAAGFKYANGRFVMTMDADRQNDPADIPHMLKKFEDGVDVVNGWRKDRQDAFLMRKLPSFIANRLIARLTNVPLRDRGCSIRIFRAEVVKELNLYGEMHRFIPEMVSFAGFKMAEVPVNHRPRVAGTSKYGISRTIRVILDLMTVLYLQRFFDRPMRLFGSLGLTFGLPGSLLTLYLAGWKVLAGLQGGWPAFHAVKLSERPLLLLAVMLVILGVQFMVMGLIAELTVRTYYETQNKPIYTIREIVGYPAQEEEVTNN
ncbi:MAG: glycosyltransferase family 2 protein [Chloroflexi bacterium]|nr:glycosyltransferase family 2 protein [Chloroflexota bacterium]